MWTSAFRIAGKRIKNRTRGQLIALFCPAADPWTMRPTSILSQIREHLNPSCECFRNGGMVWFRGASFIHRETGEPVYISGGGWVFCDRCIGEERGAQLWAFITDRYFGRGRSAPGRASGRSPASRSPSGRG